MTAAVLDDRFWAKVTKADDGCWLWTGAVTSRGYGCVGREGRVFSTHRFAYEALVGPIPAGLTLDHLCRVKVCCNPEHLEPVTAAENVRRHAATITHCLAGHEYTPENTLRNSAGHRYCRACSLPRRRVQHPDRRLLANRSPKYAQAIRRRYDQPIPLTVAEGELDIAYPRTA